MTATDSLVGAAVGVDFSKAPAHPYGYVDVEPSLNPADHFPAPPAGSSDWINCENSGTTASLALATIVPADYAPYIRFNSGSDSITTITHVQGVGSSPQTLEIKAVAGATQKIWVSALLQRGATEDVANMLFVAPYKLKKVKVAIVVANCQTTTTSLTVANPMTEQTGWDAQEFFKQGGTEIRAVDITATTITITDSESDGQPGMIDIYKDVPGHPTNKEMSIFAQNPDWSTVKVDPVTGIETHYIIQLPRGVLFLHRDTETPWTIGGWSSTPILSSNSDSHTIAHEILHHWGLNDTGPDGKNATNTMAYGGKQDGFLSYYLTHARYPPNTADEEMQWDTINR